MAHLGTVPMIVTMKGLKMSNIPKEFNHPCKNTCSGWQQGFDRGLEQSAQKIAELEAENKTLKKVQSIIGKYVETNPEIYADDCNDFGGSYSGQDIKKIRIESYKQGFFDCEMYHGPSNSIPREDAEGLVKALEKYEGAARYDNVIGAILIEDNRWCDKALTDFRAKHGGGNESS